MTTDQAFRVLIRVSQDTNRKLRVVAEELARTGEVPEHKGSESSEATVYGLSQPSRTS